jgi:hypothetical protein
MMIALMINAVTTGQRSKYFKAIPN